MSSSANKMEVESLILYLYYHPSPNPSGDFATDHHYSTPLNPKP